MRCTLCLILAVEVFVSNTAISQDTPQDPPKDPKAAVREEREKKATKAWEDAKALYEQGKFADAQQALKDFRDRYDSTSVYFENSKEIRSMLLQCGYKVASAALTKQTLVKKPHVDTILGFRFLPPDSWRGIPNWQDVYGQRSTSEVEYRGRSFRCGRYTSRFLESLYLNVHKTYAPEGVMSVAEGAFKMSYREPKGLKLTSETELRGCRYQNKRQLWEDEEGNRYAIYALFDPVAKKGFGITGYWRVSNEEGGFIFITSSSSTDKLPPPEAKDWDAAVKVFDEVAKSFEIMDQVTLANMRKEAKTWGIASDGWCVRCADWGILNTKNYTIEYATRKDFAEKLGKELESILTLYQKTIPSQKGIERGRVKLFDCEEDFQYYGQAAGAAAYWSPAQREIVAYRFEGRKVKVFEGNQEMTVAEERNPEEVTFNIIYHEAFHQYMENMMGISRDVYVPSWLNEGMGDYFFGGRWNKQGKFEIGLNDWRLETIVEAVKANKHVPLKKILYYTQQDYYSDAGLCYAEGWSICYFLMAYEEGKKKGYPQIPATMYQKLKTCGDFKKANDQVFGGIDLAKMEAEWKAFVLGFEKFLPKKSKEENRE